MSHTHKSSMTNQSGGMLGGRPASVVTTTSSMSWKAAGNSTSLEAPLVKLTTLVPTTALLLYASAAGRAGEGRRCQ